MFAAAAGAFSKLAGVAASAGTAEPETGESSIRIEADTVATLTRIPSTGVTFVSRFVKADVGRVVELMLGTPADETDGGEMDAMQFAIVAETVAQIATAMGERLASETQTAPDGTNSEVVNDAASFPVPPFTSFRAAISLGDLETAVTVDFDGIALGKIDIPAAGSAAPAAPPPAAAAAAAVPAAAMPPPAAAPPPPEAERPAPPPRVPAPRRAAGGVHHDGADPDSDGDPGSGEPGFGPRRAARDLGGPRPDRTLAA